MRVSSVWRGWLAAVSMVSMTMAAGATAPRVVFTDVPSGPVSGGEGNQGAYLSIFGRHLGSPDGLGTRTKVTIGGIEVANYRSLGPSQVAGRLGLQQLTVQVGALGGKAAGQAWPVRVSVDGVASNADVTFTPNPGRVLFVALNGNDATAVANDINHPWRHLQNNAGGAYGALRAGDQVVLRGGTWQDTLGIDGTWLRFGNDPGKKGSAPTGAAGTGWIHITRYPGPIGANAPEDVHYLTPANQRGGIQGPWSAIRGVSGEYIAISNLRLEVDATAKSDAAPINLQYSAGPWQITNNEIGPWPSTLAAPGNAKAAGISGEGLGVVIRGNHIHDIACAQGRPTNPLENHGIYIDDDGRYDIGFNVFERITGGNGLQIYTNGGFSQVTNNVSFHHNVVDGVGKHGINLADGSGKNITVFDNLVLNTQYSGLRINSVDLKGAKVYNNTFYNTSLKGASGFYGALSNDWNLKAGSVDFVNNILQPAPGTRYTGGSVGFGGAEGSWSNDLWFGGVEAVPGFAQAPVVADPKFVVAGSDFHLRAGSPAINASSSAVSALVKDDLESRRRPKLGAYDIGAYEALVP
ncbi:choice-of-anchor Q domain-containing protein [Ideonella sp.]|uniref:choice-of-anchor Q domain-containing protein n=1 Tax=Ideonella sp. TaxID=1929293 RepID=UPI0035AE1D3E